MHTSLPIEHHPLGFFLPHPTKLLLLGSFPPPQHRWSMNFYYPNFQNDMRRVLGLIFYHDKTHFITPNGKQFDAQIAKQFCTEKNIGIGDTAQQVIRLKGNASDDTLQVVKPFDIATLLQSLSECQTLVITGQKAMETLLSLLSFTQPTIGTFSPCEVAGRSIRIYRMPSTSRAYPKPVEAKAEMYEKMFREVGMK